MNNKSRQKRRCFTHKRSSPSQFSSTWLPRQRQVGGGSPQPAVPIPMPNTVKNDDRQPPQKLDHLQSTAVPTSGLLHSTDLIPCVDAASDLSAWLHWTRLGLSSGSSHCHFRAEAWLSLLLFGDVPWLRHVRCLELHSLRDRKGSSRRGTESSGLVLAAAPGKK